VLYERRSFTSVCVCYNRSAQSYSFLLYWNVSAWRYGFGELKYELNDDVHNVYCEERWVINCRSVMLFLTTVLQQCQSCFIWNLRVDSVRWTGGGGLFQAGRPMEINWCLR
jgi:hypothetical protein